MSGESRVEAVRDLARYLTGTEAGELAVRMAAGRSKSQMLGVIGPARRVRVEELMSAAGMWSGPADGVLALRAIEAAHQRVTSITPVWTTPDNLAQMGRLTTSIHHIVTSARESVVCSTFNFQRSSALWGALREVSARPEVVVRIYMDTNAADENPAVWKPSTAAVVSEMTGGTVLRTRERDGMRVVNHAKFVAVDHQFLLVTSANFSKSAEQSNVEFGLLIEHPLLTQQVERDMSMLEEVAYEVVLRD